MGPTQAHFSPSVARAKMSAEKGLKHIYAEEHQLYYYYYNFEEHLVQKQEHFATSETRMTRWLRPAGSNMLEPAKMFIRARIIRHNARQSYNNSTSVSEAVNDLLKLNLVEEVFCAPDIINPLSVSTRRSSKQRLINK